MKASSALRRFRPEAPYLVTALSFLTRLSPLLLSELSLLCLRLGHQNLCLDRTWNGDPKLLTASRCQRYLANVLALFDIRLRLAGLRKRADAFNEVFQFLRMT